MDKTPKWTKPPKVKTPNWVIENVRQFIGRKILFSHITNAYVNYKHIHFISYIKCDIVFIIRLEVVEPWLSTDRSYQIIYKIFEKNFFSTMEENNAEYIQSGKKLFMHSEGFLYVRKSSYKGTTFWECRSSVWEEGITLESPDTNQNFGTSTSPLGVTNLVRTITQKAGTPGSLLWLDSPTSLCTGSSNVSKKSRAALTQQYNNLTWDKEYDGTRLNRGKLERSE